jgi:membrane glycosyltransferase
MQRRSEFSSLQAARALAEGESKHHQDRLNIALADAVRTSTLLQAIWQNEKKKKTLCDS